MKPSKHGVSSWLAEVSFDGSTSSADHRHRQALFRRRETVAASWWCLILVVVSFCLFFEGCHGLKEGMLRRSAVLEEQNEKQSAALLSEGGSDHRHLGGWYPPGGYYWPPPPKHYWHPPWKGVPAPYKPPAFFRRPTQQPISMMMMMMPTRPTRRPTRPTQPSRRPTPAMRPSVVMMPPSRPTQMPTMASPTMIPTQPSRRPTIMRPPVVMMQPSRPSRMPTQMPVMANPTMRPTQPSRRPTIMRPPVVMMQPSRPSRMPTQMPVMASPTMRPEQPSRRPTIMRPPVVMPTRMPTTRPVSMPTGMPSMRPTRMPTMQPTRMPSGRPTLMPVPRPTMRPTRMPTRRPTMSPFAQPTPRPTRPPRPSMRPTNMMMARPTSQPTAGPSQTQPTPGPTLQSVWQLILRRPSDFSVFAQAVTTANVTETFDVLDPVTAFAATDSAFAEGPASYLNLLLQVPEFGLHLESLVLNHAVGGNRSYLSSDLVTGLRLATLAQEVTDVERTADNVVLITFANRVGITLTTSIVGSVDDIGRNGVLHDVGTVMWPIWFYLNTVDVLRIESNQRFGTLLEWITLAGLENAVASAQNVTLVAPTNEAFAALSDEVVDLLTDPDNLNALRQVILYHFLPELINVSILPLGITQVETFSSEGMLIRSVRDANGTLSVAFSAPNANSEVATSDLYFLAEFSVIYQVDTVLFPPSFIQFPFRT